MTDINKVNPTPRLVKVECGECGKRWTAFQPYGFDENEKLECPACRIMSGNILP